MLTNIHSGKFNTYNSGFIYLVVALALSITLSVPARAEILSGSEAINKAGRQRMLTQRIMKNYCLMGLSVNPESSREQMEQAINLFESQLQELKQFSPTTEISDKINSVESQWTPFKELILKTPSNDRVTQLLEMSESLLQSSEKVVNSLEDYSETPTSRLINISGRQRMLSQRIAKYYFLKAWGFNSATVISELDKAKNEFSGALNTLIEAEQNTSIINDLLGEAEIQWSWLSSSLDIGGNEFYPVIVMDASEKMLFIMDKITYLYQQMPEIK